MNDKAKVWIGALEADQVTDVGRAFDVHQEEALAAQKQGIEELRAKYLATLPKREG